MVVKRTAEQTRADGVPEHAALVRLVLEVGFVGAEFHGLSATVEFERPRAGVNACFKLELTSKAGADGTDALDRLKPLTLGVHERGLKAPHGNGRLVDDVDDHLNDVFIVVVNFHLDRCQVSVQGTCTGAVVITHSGSPVPTDRWHYFNGLPSWDALSAIEDGSRKAATSPRQRPCGAFGQRPCGTRPWWNQR